MCLAAVLQGEVLVNTGLGQGQRWFREPKKIRLEFVLSQGQEPQLVTLDYSEMSPLVSVSIKFPCQNREFPQDVVQLIQS